MGKKFIKGDFLFEETKDFVKVKDIFSNHTLYKKKRGSR